MTEQQTYAYGFEQCTTEQDVKARLRSLAKLLHPDRGGDSTLMANCKAEADRRIDEIRHPHAQNRAQERRTGARPVMPEMLQTLLQDEAVVAYIQKKIGDGATALISLLAKNLKNK